MSPCEQMAGWKQPSTAKEYQTTDYSLGNQNSQFKAWLLLNGYGFLGIIKSKHSFKMP